MVPTTHLPPSTRYKVSVVLTKIVSLRLKDRNRLLTMRDAGVMRFLQTEWHRHERDRNAWEIEKQEMKSRIANLEGQARRADASQKALKKYVTILEKKVKSQAAQLKGEKTAESEGAKPARDALLQEKLRRKFSLHS